MHGSGFISAKKVLESFLTVIPNGLVRHPDPHPLQASYGKGSIQVRTLPYIYAKVLPLEDIGIMNSGGILLACAEVFTLRKRNYSTPS